MATSPMILNFYGKNNECEKTLTRTFVPWKLLKEAIKLQDQLGDMDPKNMKPEEADAIINLMIAVFGGQFTKEEADEMCDMGEVISVLTTIMEIASGGLPKNPLQVKK